MTNYIPLEILDDSLRFYDIPEAFHPAFLDSAYRRIRGRFLGRFQGEPLGKLRFLQSLLADVMNSSACHCSYVTYVTVMGIPIFGLRNLAYTLQDPADRMVYIVRLEDAYREASASNIIPTDSFCIACFLGAIICLTGLALTIMEHESSARR